MQIFKDAAEAIEELLKNSTHVYKCKANHGTIVDGGGERRNWMEKYCNCHMAKGKAALELLKKQIEPELKSMTIPEWAFGRKDMKLCPRCNVVADFRCAYHEFCEKCTEALETNTSPHPYDPAEHP